jgi:nucleosome binding factor SPN SPT16 subunit
LKIFSVKQKYVKSVNQNNKQIISSKNLIKQIKDIKTTKIQKTTKEKTHVIHQMKIRDY